MEKCIYIFSIAFQLAGAMLLIVKYWSGSAKRQLAEIQKKRPYVENETLMLDGAKPKERGSKDYEFIEELWLNRIAFIYLAAGYIIGVWGDLANANKCCIVLLIIVWTIIFMVIGKLFSWVKGKPYKDRDVTK